MHISKCQIGPLDVTLEEKVLLEFVKAIVLFEEAEITDFISHRQQK